MTEGRHCQVHLLDDRRLELLVQVGVAHAETACAGSLWASWPVVRLLAYLCQWLGIVWGAKEQLLSQTTRSTCKSSYNLGTWIWDPWVPVSALTLSGFVTPRKWLYFSEPLVGKLGAIMFPWKGDCELQIRILPLSCYMTLSKLNTRHHQLWTGMEKA